MTYAGNPSLAQETKDRIVSTFNQTLDLAKEGRTQEAVLGCDFILKMDPLFSPAATLQTRLAAGEGPIDTSDLVPESEVAGPLEPAAGASEEVFDAFLDDMASGNRVDSAPSPPAEPPSVDAPSLDLGPDPGADVLPELDLGSDAPALTLDDTPMGSTGSESESRIDELLQEGQDAFNRKEYQTAIDAWSRIFLIDIDHAEAAQRIEEARQLKAEAERKVDEAFHEGVAHRDGGRLDEAKAAFEKVLDMQPNHPAAKEQLEMIEQGVTAPPPPPPVVGEELEPLPEAAAEMPSTADLYEEPEPDLLPQPERERPQAPARPAPKKQRSFVIVGAVVFVVLAAGGYFLWSHWGGLFPNSVEDAPVRQGRGGPAFDPIKAANDLHLSGKTDEAIAKLSELPEDNPNYARAQVLISQWQSEDVVAEPPVDASLIEEADTEQRTALLERARRYYSERYYYEAAKAFRAAERIAKLEPPAADLYEDTKEQLRPIMQQIEMYSQREWELLLPTLWRRHEEDPDNRDIEQLLVNSYYNLGLRELQRGSPDRAYEYFAEAIQIAPDDPLAGRLLLFSDTYRSTPQDLLFKIFLEQVKFRR